MLRQQFWNPSMADLLRKIQQLMDGKEWSPDTLDGIAGILQEGGYEINEPDFYPDFYEGLTQTFYLGATLAFEYKVNEQTGTPYCSRATVVPYQEDLEFNRATTEDGTEIGGEQVPENQRISPDKANELLYEYFRKYGIPRKAVGHEGKLYDDDYIVLSWES